MQQIPDEVRAEVDTRMKQIDVDRATIMEAMKPIRAQLVPFEQGLQALDGKEDELLANFGLPEVAGRCERCGKLLFRGEKGHAPYADETSMIYCEDHGMTYGDLQREWDENDAADDGEDEAEARAAAFDMINSHVASGGNLDDRIPAIVL